MQGHGEMHTLVVRRQCGMTVDSIIQTVLSLNTWVTLDRYLTVSLVFLHKDNNHLVGFTVTDLGCPHINELLDKCWLFSTMIIIKFKK